MSEYFNPKTSNINIIPVKARIRITNEIRLNFGLNKYNIDKFMLRILSDFCHSSVIGYDKNCNKYWCRKYKKSICDFHLEIKIIMIENTTEIIIKPIICYNDDIKNFIEDLNDGIDLINTSNFVRSIISEL